MKPSVTLALLTIACILVPASWFLAQGPLAPPGAPAPTMKTLDQIEPRTPIPALPFTISASGSYYLTGNLLFSATTGDAITISQSNVTLDLMGFTLSSTAGVTGNAILMNGNLRNIAVKNGVIAGNTTVTTSGSPPNQTWNITPAGFSSGIIGTSASSCQFSHLRISGCRSYALNVGTGATIDQVTTSSNGSTGIIASSGSVTNSTARSNGGIGILANSGSVTNSTALSNGSDAIVANSGSVTNSTATSNGGIGIAASNGSVINSAAILNRVDGISAVNGSVINSTATSNGGSGISASNGNVTSSAAISNNLTGVNANGGSVTNSTVRSNGDDGISASNGVVAFCKAFDNNTNNNGSLNINAAGATRTGNNPTP